MKLDNFLSRITNDCRFAKDIIHHKVLVSNRARYEKVEPPLAEPIPKALADKRIANLYLHQARAILSARQGNNVVTVTPTASGKTLVYFLPIIERMLLEPQTRALLLFPLKALAQDQLKRLKDFGKNTEISKFTSAIYDGDTTSHFRAKIRKNPPHFLLTNPDMLHFGILPFHTKWETFFRNLRFIVIDELHYYKGIFGSHVLQILRRLRRVALFYQSEPQFLTTSATIGNPRFLAEQLTGLPFDLIKENGAPISSRHIFFVNPSSKSLYTTATNLFIEAMKLDQKVIVFTKARKITELIHQWTLQSNPKLREKISAYRAGYLPTERREIESKLQSGQIKGVISTSALEMGIDIGGLDVCILVGYPGTITATWQRAGRVGRGQDDSAIFLIAQPDALDQYFMRHPEDFFQREAESGVVDEANPHLLKNHLICAAQEVPLRNDDHVYPVDTYQKIIHELTKSGDLVQAGGGMVWFSNEKQPQRKVNIRGTGLVYTILEEGKGRTIGHVTGLQAFTEGHPGAVYLHGGQTFVVNRLDLGAGEIWVSKGEVSYYTVAQTTKETKILEIFDTRKNKEYQVTLGRIEVTARVTGYAKRHTFSREKIRDYVLEMPPVIYETVGLWIEPSHAVISSLINDKNHLMGSLHALEHASLALLPLFALCDRNDVAGISLTSHYQLGSSAIFLYDAHQGGVGLAAKAYEVLEKLLKKVFSLVEKCLCEDGCPSCIHSPKCGHGNVPLDKLGCINLLQYLNGEKEVIKTVNDHHVEATTRVVDKRSGAHLLNNKEDNYHSQLPLVEKKDVVIFDLETQLSAQEVGGWHNAHLMRISLGVVYERLNNKFITYYEDTVLDLLQRLWEAELVIGFNQKRFDYTVLQVYTGKDLSNIRSFDILEQIYCNHGFRLSLDTLASATFGENKSANGLLAIQWWKEGKIKEIEQYCRTDVELTSRLFNHILQFGYLLYEKKNCGKVRLPLEISIKDFFSDQITKKEG